MNRQINMSNGGNPFGNFNATTTNFPLNRNNYNFNQGYMPNQTMIEKPDFKNRGELIHNNVNDNVLSEHVTEYQIHIDSKDRTVTAYPNPCKFTVTFGGSGSQTVRRKVIYKAEDKSQQRDYYEKVEIQGTPGPIIQRKFKNVKYIKLDYLILPRTLALVPNSSGEYELSTDPNDYMTKYKYLIVKIKEVSSQRILSTNKAIGNDCFIVYPDKLLGGDDNSIWVSSNGARVYNNGLLGNLDKLTISINDPDGNVLMVTDTTTDLEVDLKAIDDNCSLLLAPQIDSLKCLYNYLQINLSFLLGVVENEIQTDTKFES